MYKLKIKSLKGMHDCFSRDIYLYQYIENMFKIFINKYSFQEIRFPILENTFLFSKFISNNYNNNILKEMYSFLDKKKISLSLRPEGTVCCFRAYIENKLFLDSFLNKLWYIGSMFRYERPQKCRFRQFNQIGLEIFNDDSFVSNIELLLIINNFFKMLEINDFLYLEINCIGNFDDRKKYLFYIKKNFLNIIKKKFPFFKDDSNFFRFLDKNNKNINILIPNIPSIFDFINCNSKFNFNKLCRKLDLLNIKYIINKNLVRGLDYYNDFVFEWKSNFLNKNITICSGGRYDFLGNYLCNKYIPAVGCAIGLERLFFLLKSKKKKVFCNKIDIYIYSSYNEYSKMIGLIICDKIINSSIKSLNVYNNYFLNKKINKIISLVIKKNIRFLIIIDKKEIEGNYIILKDLFLNIQKKVFIYNIIENIIYFLNKNII